MDEDGALVPRTEIKGGATHFELCSPEHCWVLVASPIVMHKTRGAHHFSEGDERGAAGDAVSPAVMVLRPSPSSLVEGRCTSLLWSPRSSLSVSQRVYPKQRSSLAGAKEIPDGGSDDLATSPPYIHIQIFDGGENASGFHEKSVTESKLSVKLPDWRKMKSKSALQSSFRK